jgi:hypothetical protein
MFMLVSCVIELVPGDSLWGDSLILLVKLYLRNSGQNFLCSRYLSSQRQGNFVFVKTWKNYSSARDLYVGILHFLPSYVFVKEGKDSLWESWYAGRMKWLLKWRKLPSASPRVKPMTRCDDGYEWDYNEAPFHEEVLWPLDQIGASFRVKLDLIRWILWTRTVGSMQRSRQLFINRRRSVKV